MEGWNVEPEVKGEDAGWALLAPTQPHSSERLSSIKHRVSPKIWVFLPSWKELRVEQADHQASSLDSIRIRKVLLPLGPWED